MSSNSGSTSFEKGGNAGSKGVDFQINLLIVTFLNALKTLKDWKLSTENPKAGKFDDVVLEWPDGSVLLQAKFKENKKKITLEDLMSVNSKKSEFSLPKYYFSYQDIKGKFNDLKDLILCTNTDISINKKFLNRNTADSNSILHNLNRNCCLCKFTDDLVPDLKVKIQEYHDQNSRNINIDRESVTENNIREFLARLQFYCNYPSEGKLTKAIEELISRLDYSSNLWSKTSSILLFRKMMDWFQRKNGLYLTETHAKAMFCEIRSDKYCEELEKYQIFFHEDDLIFQDPNKVFHVVTDNLLDVIKVYRCLESSKKRNVMYVNPDDGIEVLRDAIEAFQLPQYAFLIIAWPKTTDESELVTMCDTLRNALQKRCYKKIILVANDENSLTRQIISLSDSCEVITSSASVKDVTKETWEKLTEARSFVFQGQNVNLQQLEVPEQVVTPDILEKLVVGEQITVGGPVPRLDEQIERFYINREFISGRKLVSEEEIYDKSDKVVVISDYAGMGKSTILTQLANVIKAKHPHLWVIKINLNDYTSVFNHALKKRRKMTTIELLNGKQETKLSTKFEEEVFLIKEKVVLMLDGVDEISPDYTGIVLHLLGQCRKQDNFAKIFVTTRRHVARNLEESLQAKSFTLEPLNEKDQVELLVTYWAHNLNLDEILKEKCKKYAAALMQKIFSFSYDFADVPLHVVMLAEVFQENYSGEDWQGCKEYLHADEASPKLTNKLKLTELYTMFIENKKYIFLDKVNPSGIPAGNSTFTREFNQCLTCHRAVALEEVLNEEERQLFLYEPVSSDTETEMLRMGIVQKWDNKMIFVHRTFAEYFVAESLVRELQRKNSNIEFQKFLIENILINEGFEVIRAFFDGFLRGVVEVLPVDIFDNYYNSNTSILTLNKTGEEQFFHSLASGGFAAIFEVILKYLNCKITKDQRQFVSCDNILKRLQCALQREGVDILDDMNKTPLHYAVESNQLEMMKYLIGRGANISRYIDTLFDDAIHFAHLEIVQYLVEQGASITERRLLSCTYDYTYKRTDIAAYLLNVVVDKNQLIVTKPITPYVAAYLGNLHILQALIKRGIDLNCAIENGDVASFGAVRGGHFEILQYLFRTGAETGQKNYRGETVLHIACKGHLPIVKFLIEKLYLDINITDSKGQTPLHFAALEGQLDIVWYLVEERKADVNVKDNDNQTPLYCVLRSISFRGDLGIILFFLERNADIEVKNNLGRTAVHLAAFRGYLDIFRFLVEKCNADMNVEDNGGQTPLHLAAFRGSSKIVEYLARTTDINIKDKRDRTPLHYAALRGHADVVRVLGSGNANVNVTDNKGETPLHLAVFRGFLYIVLVLVEKQKADVNIKDNEGRTPLHYAAIKGHLDIFQFLVDKHNADFNARDSQDQTPLHLAVFNCRYNIVRFLLIECNADGNVQDNEGRTPLHYAALKGYSSIIQLLVEHNGNINIKDTKGETPLHLAAVSGHLDIVRFFVEELNGDIYVKNYEGQTALDLAVKNNCSNVVAYLTGKHKNI